MDDNYRNSARPPRVNDYVQLPGDTNLSRVLRIRNGALLLEMEPGQPPRWVDPQTVDLYDPTRTETFVPEEDLSYNNHTKPPQLGDQVRLVSIREDGIGNEVSTGRIRTVTKIFPNGKLELDGESRLPTPPKFLDLDINLKYLLDNGTVDEIIHSVMKDNTQLNVTNGRSPLMRVLEHDDNLQLVEAFLSNGADVNYIFDDRSALQMAISFYKFKYTYPNEFRENLKQIIKLLIKHGADTTNVTVPPEITGGSKRRSTRRRTKRRR